MEKLTRVDVFRRGAEDWRAGRLDVFDADKLARSIADYGRYLQSEYLKSHEYFGAEAPESRAIEREWLEFSTLSRSLMGSKAVVYWPAPALEADEGIPVEAAE